MELQHPPLVRKLAYILFGLCPVIFFTDQTRNPFHIQIVLVSGLVALAWLVWMAQMWRANEWTWVISPLDPLLGALIAVSLASWAHSFYVHRVFASAVYSEGSKGFLFLLLNTYLVYAMALRLQDVVLFRRLLMVAYAVSLIASLYGIAQYFGTEWIWPQTLNPYGMRPVSTFGNPNFFSTFLVLILPVAVADFAFRFTPMPRPLMFLLVLANLGALLATLTRSSWAGLLVAMILWTLATAPQWDVSRKRSLMGLFAAMALLVVLWPQSSGQNQSAAVERLAEIGQVAKGSYTAVDQRLLIWTSAWHMVEDQPVLGNGWGCFELFFPYYQGPQLLFERFRLYRTHANNAHNEILEYWSQAGTIGLGVMLLLWIAFFRMAHSAAERSVSPALHWALTAGVAGVLVDNLLNVSVHFTTPALFFWWWVASVFALDGDARRIIRLPLTGLRRVGLVLAAVFLMGSIARSASLWVSEAEFFKGFNLAKAGVDLNGAARDLETARRFHPLEVNTNYELANLYARLGDRPRALQMYGRALDANPGYDEIFFNRGTLLMQMQRFDESLDCYRLAVAINPGSHDASRALVAVLVKDIPRYGGLADGYFEQALAFFPGDKDLWNNYGYVATQRYDWEKAYGAYRSAFQIDPDFDVARRNLLIIAAKVPRHAGDPVLQLPGITAQADRLLKAKNWTSALPLLEKIVAIAPQSLRGRLFLGNAYFALNRLPEAAAQFEAALKFAPEAPAPLQNLAVTYDRLERPEAALNIWRRILQLDPKNPLANRRLGTQPPS